MGLFDFAKSVGAKIFGKADIDKDPDAATKPVLMHLKENGIDVTNVKTQYLNGIVTISGWVPNLEQKEKSVLIAGNVQGVSKVDDLLRVGAPPAPVAVTSTPGGVQAGGTAVNMSANEPVAHTEDKWASRTYTVEKGDTLSKIAKEMYGKASKYPVIFEANKPMLKDPDEIYPGQVLRIPALPEDAK